jgi:tetratricopeptide (TPR) repeat protein
VIELTLEAGDTNPNLLGLSVSEPARVHIISREQYAEILRSQATLEDFAGRYEVLSKALEEAREAVEALEKAAASGDPAKLEEARKAAQEAHAKAGKIFGQIAKDFPIFDLDESLATAALQVAKNLLENANDLEQLQGDELAEAIPQLKERLGESSKQLADEMKQGERAIAAAKVLDQMGKFRELLDSQRELVKDLNRVVEQIRRGETQAGLALRDLAASQRKIAEGLKEMETNLGSALGELPEEFQQLKDEGADFLEALGELKIPPTMIEGADAGDAADSKTASDRAGAALAKLEALLRKKNALCEMCRGESGTSFPWPQDLSTTLEQLMRSLCQKPGMGEGENPGAGAGGGTGFGGRSSSGFAMKGKMPQLPIFGPSRSRLAMRGGPEAGSRGGSGRGNGRGEEGVDLGSNSVAPRSAPETRGEGIALEAVPEAYRDAVKRYFSTEEPSAPDAPTTPQKQ